VAGSHRGWIRPQGRLLALLEQACGQGWTVRDTCQVLQVSELRLYRWLGRQAAGRLADQVPGGRPLHGLLDEGVAKIIELFHQWGEIDRSHRKLAHRGSYLEQVWVSPSSVRRMPERERLLELIGARQDGLVDPTDQAWIESLFGHVKAEWPHLLAIGDPAVLRAELAVVRERYNGVRLHAGIGYVTPNDEHEGRGEQIRKTREAGLEQARLRRLAWHRAATLLYQPREPPLARPHALVQCPATRGFVVGTVVGIPRWHARGQKIEVEVSQESSGGD
jgi:hypothetical protein